MTDPTSQARATGDRTAMCADPLTERLRALEDIEAIRRLKARYFHCCDRKDPEGMRDCFVPGQARIDYGPLGVFDHRDQLVELFERLGCHDHIVEMHHGSNPQIEIVDERSARGVWSLYFQRIDTRAHTLTQLGGWYEDVYVKDDSRWRIAQTRCVIDSNLVLSLADAVARVLGAGRPTITVPQPGAPA